MRVVRPSDLLPKGIVPSWVSEPTGCPVPRLICSTPAMNVEDTAPSPTSSTPSFPTTGLMLGPPDATKSLGSRLISCWSASSISRSCHCDDILPVLSQWCTVLSRSSRRVASVDWPPKRSMICLALIMDKVPVLSLAVNSSRYT